MARARRAHQQHDVLDDGRAQLRLLGRLERLLGEEWCCAVGDTFRSQAAVFRR